MNKLSSRIISTRITNLMNAHNKDKVTELLYNVAFQCAHGNVDNAIKLTDSSIPAVIRGWIGKNCGIKKKKGEYVFDKKKQEKILIALELDFQPAFEDMAAVLPPVYPERRKEVKKVDVLAKTKRFVAAIEKALEEGQVEEGQEGLAEAELAHLRDLLDKLLPTTFDADTQKYTVAAK